MLEVLVHRQEDAVRRGAQGLLLAVPSNEPLANRWFCYSVGLHRISIIRANSYKVYDSFCDQLIRRASILEHGDGNCKPQAAIQYQILWFIASPGSNFLSHALIWRFRLKNCRSH